MVSKLERNLSFCGLGLIYCLLGYKVYNKLGAVNDREYKLIRNEAEKFLDKQSKQKDRLKALDMVFLDNLKKIVIVFSIEDSKNTVKNSEVLSDLFFQLSPDKVIVERSFY